jgi:hypothetical protein
LYFVWVGLFASPNPAVKGVWQRRHLCLLATSAYLELHFGCLLPRELSESFERTGQWLEAAVQDWKLNIIIIIIIIMEPIAQPSLLVVGYS